MHFYISRAYTCRMPYPNRLDTTRSLSRSERYSFTNSSGEIITVQVSRSTKMILVEINKMVANKENYKLLDQFSYKEFEVFEEETRDTVFPEALRIYFDWYSTVPGILVYLLSVHHAFANHILDDAIVDGVATGQIHMPNPPQVEVGALSYNIKYPDRPGSFQPDGMAVSYDDPTHPFMIWETNYQRGPVDATRQWIQRVLQSSRGLIRTGILLARHESKGIWTIEVFRYFNTDTYDNYPEQILTANRVIHQEGKTDQFVGVNRVREMENIGRVRKSLKGNRRHAVYSQEGGHYIIWPPERAVKWIPLQMSDLFLGFEHEYAAVDGMDAPDATFMFYVHGFRPV